MTFIYWMLILIGAVAYGALKGFQRRWFGGLYENHKILGNRGLQAAAMIISDLAVSAIIPLAFEGWVFYLVAALWLGYNTWFYAQYWSRAHGPEFDLARGGKPDAVLIERYSKYWYHGVVKKIIKEENWYGYRFDFLCMMFRYAAPMIVTLPFGLSLFMAGIMTPFIYAHCWTLSEKDSEWFKELGKKYPAVGSPTCLAEVLVGFVYGFAFVIYVANLYARI